MVPNARRVSTPARRHHLPSMLMMYTPPMKTGEMDYAIRRALNLFDKWNDCTGVVEKHTTYYYEMQAVIEDAVHCGAQRALGIEELLESEKI